MSLSKETPAYRKIMLDLMKENSSLDQIFMPILSETPVVLTTIREYYENIIDLYCIKEEDYNRNNNHNTPEDTCWKYKSAEEYGSNIVFSFKPRLTNLLLYINHYNQNDAKYNYNPDPNVLFLLLEGSNRTQTIKKIYQNKVKLTNRDFIEESSELFCGYYKDLPKKLQQKFDNTILTVDIEYEIIPYKERLRQFNTVNRSTPFSKGQKLSTLPSLFNDYFIYNTLHCAVSDIMKVWRSSCNKNFKAYEWQFLHRGFIIFKRIRDDDKPYTDFKDDKTLQTLIFNSEDFDHEDLDTFWNELKKFTAILTETKCCFANPFELFMMLAFFFYKDLTTEEFKQFIKNGYVSDQDKSNRGIWIGKKCMPSNDETSNEKRRLNEEDASSFCEYYYKERIIDLFEKYYNGQLIKCPSTCNQHYKRQQVNKIIADRIKEWDKLQCRCCGKQVKERRKNDPDYATPDTSELGHIISCANGGNTHVNNIVICCFSCNRNMGSTNMDEYQKHNFPTMMPVLDWIEDSRPDHEL